MVAGGIAGVHHGGWRVGRELGGRPVDFSRPHEVVYDRVRETPLAAQPAVQRTGLRLPLSRKPLGGGDNVKLCGLLILFSQPSPPTAFSSRRTKHSQTWSASSRVNL